MIKTINIPVEGKDIERKERTGKTWPEILELGIKAAEKELRENEG